MRCYVFGGSGFIGSHLVEELLSNTHTVINYDQKPLVLDWEKYNFSRYTYASGDIISMSFDTENGIIKWYKNDTLVTNSTITNSQLEFANDEWIPMIYCANGNGSFSASVNFGNGYFGTTAVSSAGTNASGIGIFEYDVPTGYTALSTKGLNL